MNRSTKNPMVFKGMKFLVINCFVLVLFYLDFIYCKDTFKIESAIIRCNSENDDEGVVDWKPPPLVSFNQEIHVGPHESISALDQQIENDVDLQISPFSKCRNKGIITIKVIHEKNGNIKDQNGEDEDEGTIIRIDHMFEEQIKKPVRLGNSIAIKIQKGPIFRLFPIKFIQTVNAKVSEKILIVDNCNEQSCDHEDEDSFQLESILDYEPKGFCCNCDSINQDGIQFRSKLQCKTNTSGSGTNSNFQQSAHCYNPSSYWYGVFALGEEEIFHQIYVQIYKGKETSDGNIEWIEASKQQDIIKVDSHNETSYNEEDQLKVTYRKILQFLKKEDLKIYEKYLLLPTIYYSIPNQNQSNNQNDELYETNSIVTGTKEIYHQNVHKMLNHDPSKLKDVIASSDLPQPLKNGIDDSILLIPKKLLNEHCNSVGVSVSSFRNQESPCIETKGTCLKNQPFDLWTNPKNRLTNYGNAHSASPFKWINNHLYFVMEQIKDESKNEIAAYLDLQLNMDDIEILRGGYEGTLSNVITSTSSTGSKIIIEIYNKEQLPSFFSVHLLSCSNKNFPIAKTKEQIIGPLSVQLYQIDLHYLKNGVLAGKDVICSIALLNQYNQVVSSRLIRFKMDDTCICYMDCNCVCTKESLDFSCNKLPLDQILAAGIDLETEDYLQDNQKWFRKNRLLLAFGIILFFLLLGMLKAVFGMCCDCLGKFGISSFDNEQYFDSEYQTAKESAENTSKQLNRRKLSSAQQFGCNLTFFFTFPIIAIMNCFKFIKNKINANRTESSSEISKSFDLNSEFGSSQDLLNSTTNGPKFTENSAKNRFQNNLLRNPYASSSGIEQVKPDCDCIGICKCEPLFPPAYELEVGRIYPLFHEETEASEDGNFPGTPQSQTSLINFPEKSFYQHQQHEF